MVTKIVSFIISFLLIIFIVALKICKNICIKKYQKELGLYYFNSIMPENAQFNRSSIGQDLNLELLATELPKETFIYQQY